MLNDLQHLRDEVSEAVSTILVDSEFSDLSHEQKRDFWNEYLYEQGYLSTNDEKERLGVAAQQASLERFKSDMEAEEAKIKKLRLDDDERRKLRSSWGPSVRTAFMCTLSITIVAIVSFWIIDIVALRHPELTVDPTKMIINQSIIIALITATVAEAAAMALIITRWGFEAPPG